MKKDIVPAEKFLKDLFGEKNDVYKNLILQGETEEEITQRILDLIDTLPSTVDSKGRKIHKDLVIEYYGFKDGDCKTFQQLAKKYNVANSSIRQKTLKSLRILKYYSERFLYTKKDYKIKQEEEKVEYDIIRPAKLELYEEVPIDYLKLGDKVIRFLKRANIQTIKDLAMQSRESLLKKVRISGISLKIIENCLQSKGLTLDDPKRKDVAKEIELKKLKTISLDDFIYTISLNPDEYLGKMRHFLWYYGNIKTLYDLTQLSENDLLNIRGVGVKSVETIKKALNKLGLSLKSNTIEPTNDLGV